MKTENMNTCVMKNPPLAAPVLYRPATGKPYLIESAVQYLFTIKNYAQACKAAENTEYHLPEEDW